MRIYIAEDDLSVITVLEDIIDSCRLGSVCGSSGENPPDTAAIAALCPDIVLVDFLMPEKDGVQLVRELKALNLPCRCIMLSQVSSKDLVGKAYDAGVDFFISKPINYIEVKSVLENVTRQIENDRKLASIQKIFSSGVQQPAAAEESRLRQRRLQLVLNQLGISSEKGGDDIVMLCEYLLEHHLSLTQTNVGQLCAALSSSPKTMEQRVRRAIAKSLTNLAHMGLEDYSNDVFVRWSGTLFPFEELRAEMDYIRGKRGQGGKINIKKFLDGLLLLLEEEN